jgi:hypothetical protein
MFKPVDMKLYYLLFIAGLMAINGCKKTGTPAVPNPTTTITNTPTLLGGGFQPGIPFSTTEFNIYDLDHDNNKDKKYFRIELYSVDSARIVMEPKPIDSLALGWPAAVKKISWSPGAEFIVDDQSFIRMQGGSFIQTLYNQTSPQHSWVLQYRYTIFGPFAQRRLPNTEVILNGESHQFYLDQSHPYINKIASTTVNGYPEYNLYLMSDFYAALPGLAGQAFDLYDYTGVTSMIYLTNLNTYYFFDFKNWRYWVIDRSGGLNEGFRAHPVKSLDKFLKWPAGWGKK